MRPDKSTNRRRKKNRPGMSEELQKKVNSLVQRKAGYGMALALVAALLLAIGFPVYLLVFFGVFTFFVWKAFSHTERNDTRSIFEFYLAANEMLRDDEKRWFGFEMQEVLHAGEKILSAMPDPPPLVLFTLGALHHKIGNYTVATKYLGLVAENEQMDEKHRLIASPELKNYVRILRKIEREPSEAPQTSAAIRALERARRNRSAVLLEESRQKKAALNPAVSERPDEKAGEDPAILDLTASAVDHVYAGRWDTAAPGEEKTATAGNGSLSSIFEDNNSDGKENSHGSPGTNDKPGSPKSISEVLKDIYDR